MLSSGDFCSAPSSVFYNIRLSFLPCCFWCLSVWSLHQLLHVICVPRVPELSPERGFRGDLVHRSVTSQRSLAVPHLPSRENLQSYRHSLGSQSSLQTSCFLIALTCWFRQRDKAGTPYTCWSNCKSVETSIASILFPKRNVLWKTALLPPCNFFQSLMRAGVEAMPTENN